MLKTASLLFIMFPSICHAGAQDDFEAYKQEFNTYKQQENASYRAYTEKMEREWNDYLRDIKVNFGSLEHTSDKKWVNYSDDHKSRVVLDNDKKSITVEFVADEQGKAEAIRKTKALIGELSKEVNPISNVPALTENVMPDSIRPEAAKPVRASSKPGEKVYSITVPLNEDGQENNEVQFAETVRDMAEKYNVSYDLVMAIIKTESNFNVGAGTRAGAVDIRNPEQYENNAWGVMQVNPRRGGREGWKRAKGQDRLPSADELRNPKTNLEIGVAYLAALQESHLKAVQDPTVRELLMVAAYRDGPEKVLARFSKKGNKAEAIAAINRLNSDEVSSMLAGKAAGSPSQSEHYASKVARARDNYRVGEKDKQKFAAEAQNIVKNPELLATINQWLGTPYRLGGTTKSAVDCSGFTRNIYSEVFNKTLPRTAEGQYMTYGRSALDGSDRREGDLVYFNTLHNGNPVSHVGIWLNGKRFVHASSSRGVMISGIDDTYFRTRYVGANRPAR